MEGLKNGYNLYFIPPNLGKELEYLSGYHLK
jgi:hypothetical protein